MRCCFCYCFWFGCGFAFGGSEASRFTDASRFILISSIPIFFIAGIVGVTGVTSISGGLINGLTERGRPLATLALLDLSPLGVLSVGFLLGVPIYDATSGICIFGGSMFEVMFIAPAPGGGGGFGPPLPPVAYITVGFITVDDDAEKLAACLASTFINACWINVLVGPKFACASAINRWLLVTVCN